MRVAVQDAYRVETWREEKMDKSIREMPFGHKHAAAAASVEMCRCRCTPR